MSAAKSALRRQILAARQRQPASQGTVEAAGIASAAMAWEPVRASSTVTAYVSVGTEPATGLLLEALIAAGKRVLLPVLLPNLDLDWAEYTGPDALAPARRGLLEPSGERLGVGAVAMADVVLAPGLAVSPAGDRLGQGGGCYDRALARVRPGTPVAVVLHEDEVGLAVPTAAHDVRVGFVVTQRGVQALSVGGGDQPQGVVG